ncbi:MAG: WD40 repeat protein [bacterium]|jgi:WD40 repeat protein
MRLYLFVTLILFIVLSPALSAKEEYILHRSYYSTRGDIFSGGITPDGRFISAIDRTHRIRLWNVESGGLFKIFRNSRHRAAVLAHHPIKPWIITGGYDRTIRIWNIKSGKEIKTLKGHTGSVLSLSVSQSGEFLLSGGADDKVILWDLKTFKVKKIFIERRKKVYALTFHPSLDYFAVGTSTFVKVWNIKTGKEVVAHSVHRKSIFEVQFSPKGDLLASASVDRNIVLYNWKSKKIIKGFTAHQQAVTGLNFITGTKNFLSCSLDGKIYIWNRKGVQQSSINLVDAPVKRCRLSADGKRLVVVFAQNRLRVYKFGENGFLAPLKGHRKSIVSLDFTRDGNSLLSVDRNNIVKLWSTSKKKVQKSFKIKKQSITYIRLFEEYGLFATAGRSGNIIFWSLENGKEAFMLRGHKGKVNSFDFHPTKQLLISVGADKKIVLWDLKKRKILYQKRGHRNQIYVVRFSPNGSTYATASADKTIKVWSLKDHRLLYNFSDHKRSIRDIAFNPSGTVLASASDDATIKLWDLSKGKLMSTLEGHDKSLSAIRFSPDGEALVSASRDKTIRLWNVKKGKFIRTLSGEQEQVTTIALTANGQILATGSLGREINLLRLPSKIFKAPRKLGNNQNSKKENNNNQKNEHSNQKKKSNQNNLIVQKKGNINITDFGEEKIGKSGNPLLFQRKAKNFTQKSLEGNQKRLNELLSVGNFCKTAQLVQKTAYAVLASSPNDKAAYYALMKSNVYKQDLQMIFLMSKLGEKMLFFPQWYNFTTKLEVNNYYLFWKNYVFNRAYAGDLHKLVKKEGQSLIKLEFVDCLGEVHEGSMPKNLLHIDIPVEISNKIITQKIRIDYQAFAGLVSKPNVFRKRVFALIQAVDNNEKVVNYDVLKKYMVKNNNVYGYYMIDISKIQQWNIDGRRIMFQLKRNNFDWWSFYSDPDKTKVMLLQKGNYYLKINDQVRRAFIIKSKNQVVKTKIQR